MLQSLLNQIDAQKIAIATHGNAAGAAIKRANYQLRLDWNYHSNAIEGSSLTREETRSVMINNITVSGKPLKDIMEMRGHDEVVTQIIAVGRAEQRLSEARIRAIHTAIMYEETAEARTKIGVWKTVANYLYNYRGERIDFTEPHLVANEMHDLINWYSAAYEKIETKKQDAIHPLLLAFEFHLRYVTIHPFYDGNGRTARIFTNLILIAHGYPPAIVKTEDKEVYGRYLADIQVYGGEADAFYTFMAQQVLEAQNLILAAISEA